MGYEYLRADLHPERITLQFERDWFFNEHVLPWFNNNIDQDAKILNLGCGVGMEARELEANGFTNIYPFDLNVRLLKLARFALPLFAPASIRKGLAELFTMPLLNQLTVRLFNAQELRSAKNQRAIDATDMEHISDDTFDVVLLKDLLMPQDLNDRVKMLREARRVLKNDGYLIIQSEINPKHKPVYSKDYCLEPGMLSAQLENMGFNRKNIEVTTFANETSKWRPLPTPQMFIVAKK